MIQAVTSCSVLVDRIDRASCVVDRSIHRAYEQRDVVKLLCLKDKSAQIGALKNGPRDASAQKRAIDLQIESTQCIGELALDVVAQNEPDKNAPAP